MASVKDQIDQISSAKASIKSALSAKGVNMSNIPFTQYGAQVNALFSISGLSGYTLQTGTLCSGTTATIPAAQLGKVIPIALKVTGGNSYEGRSTNNYEEFTLNAVTGSATKALFQFTAAKYGATVSNKVAFTLYLPGYMSQAELLALKSVSSVVTNYTSKGVQPTLAITVWLQK